ncbi:hypothetical protein GCM10010211_71230 [Streptomyces albospinus]|uniref:Uncharacterized protein n=1 Tax=Streptomyces albospinus TaxID=285515 RepID=A0ABQ2VKK5_9ACTN|nr:hypothetical protein GCM10010211_71230 [Streptomyces albospinus]
MRTGLGAGADDGERGGIGPGRSTARALGAAVRSAVSVWASHSSIGRPVQVLTTRVQAATTADRLVWGKYGETFTPWAPPITAR